MKIVHVSHLYHPSKGGVQYWFKNVSERLVKDYGDDVTVVTTDSMYGPERTEFSKIEPATEVINGVKVIRFPFNRWHIRPYWIAYKVLAKIGMKMPASMTAKAYGPWSPKLENYLMNADTDVVCAASSNYHYMQLPIWKQMNFFYFGCVHLSEDLSKPVLRDIQKKSIDASTLYISNTNYEAKRLQQAGVSSNKIKTLGVGVDPSSFDATSEEISALRTSLDIPDHAIVIGYVGRVERTKNVALLVESFVKLSQTHTEIYLLLAGTKSDYSETLKADVDRLDPQIRGKIKWLLDFETSEKAALFHSIDVFVLPSSNESFGIVFLEAWICGKPVVGANIGAVRDVINEHEDGLLFEANSVESLSEKIETLINNDEQRISMGSSGYKKVNENFTWDIITSKLRECYVNSLKN
jgi:glycosyltransferase involved in cell wall biosynthesis